MNLLLLQWLYKTKNNIICITNIIFEVCSTYHSCAFVIYILKLNFNLKWHTITCLYDMIKNCVVTHKVYIRYLITSFIFIRS